jgi:DNA-binding IclR family transcriptional regulator
VAKTFEKLLELPGSAEEKTDRQFITALARGLEILRTFEPGDGPLGNQELAERTKLPKPTVSRITHTLTMLGYLEYNRRLEKYTLGAAVFSLGYACLANLGIRSIARPHMQELADYTEASVALGTRDRLQMTYIELCRGNLTVSLRLDVGARVPLHRSAMGMSFLFALPETERDFLLGAIRRRDGNEWSETRKRLDKAFKELDAHGFCVSLGKFERTINGAGAPFVSHDKSTVYAFNCSGPAFQLPPEKLYEDVGPRLVATVRNIAADIGRQHLLY